MRPLAVAVCVAQILAALTGLIVTTRTGHHQPAVAAAPSRLQPVRGAPTVAQVDVLLARHGAAVLARDAGRVAADLDTAPAAAGFRARQLAELGALAQVPLRSWSYTVSAPLTGGGVLTTAAQRYGAPALIARVSLSYALAGVDAQPTSHDLWWTFVLRAGHPVIAGDDDLADQGGTSWRGPWDFGALDVARGAHRLVMVHPDHASLLPALSAAVDRAVPEVSSVWGTGWTRDVAVIVPDSDAETAELAGSAQPLRDIAALAVADSVDTSDGIALGQRVIVNPDNLDRLDPVGRQIVLQHEITHVATRAVTGPAAPTWLVEGFADYVGNLGSGQPVTVAAAELAADVRAGRLPASLPQTAAFSGGAAAQAYEQAWLACRLIAGRVGVAGLVRFYRQVGLSAAAPDAAVATGLAALLHMSTARFTADWRAYLRSELS